MMDFFIKLYRENSVLVNLLAAMLVMIYLVAFLFTVGIYWWNLATLFILFAVMMIVGNAILDEIIK